MDISEKPGAAAARNVDDLSFELSTRRTGLSFQRTRMSADRTLMSIMRTALSLIGFGFTVFQFFRYLRDSAGAEHVRVQAARNFGIVLISLGIGMLAVGIVNHVKFMLELRAERRMLLEENLLHSGLSFPISLTLVAALLLLLIGFAAMLAIGWRSGPFN